MQLMHGTIKDTISRIIVSNCRSDFYCVDVHRGSVLTPLRKRL